MQNPITVIDAIEGILEECRSWDRPGQIGAFAALTILIRDLDLYIEKIEMPGRAYLSEKLTGVESHVRAMLGMDYNSGHSAESHFSWAYGELQTARDLFEEAKTA